MSDAKQARGEFDLIARYFRGLDQGPDVALGNGDDAALLRLSPGEELAVSVDSMLDGVHFPERSPASEVAYRAVAAAASDLAAMGARPLGMTLALTLPAADDVWLSGCRIGLSDAVSDFKLPLVGGDLTRGPLALTVQVMGAVPAGAALRRSGASPGDLLYVSGSLGDAAAGLALIQGKIRAPADAENMLRARFWRPQPAFEQGILLRGKASSAIDLSDGLLADAEHLAQASEVRISIDSTRLPLSAELLAAVSAEQAIAWALGGGEDYRLCFTLPEAIAPPAGCSCVGCVEPGSGVRCDVTVSAEGYRHF